MKASITPSASAPLIRAYGDEIRVHLSGQHTGNAFTMFTDIAPPGGGPPPHFHVAEDEWWYVLDGQAEFLEGGKWTAVGPGGAVFMPANTTHTFRNAGTTPLRNVILTSPSGIEDFFRESELEFERGATPELARLLAIGAAHGIHFPTLAPGSPVGCGTPALPPSIVQPGAGRTLRAFGEEVEVMLEGARTGGAFTMFVETTPPDGGPPPHWHEKEDEWFLVLEGCVSFFLEGRWVEAHAGAAVLAPRQQVHTFKNRTAQATKMLIHTAPSGFEEFFAEAAAEFSRPSGPDMRRAVAIAEAHGIHFVTP